jgi:carbon monoxide dehydrogenase subunit G
MELAGQTDFRVPRDRVAQALRDPDMLRRMIPACTGVTRLSPDTYEARIEKAAGPVTLRMTAQVSVEDLGQDRYILRAKGRSTLAGSVVAVLTLALLPAPGGTSLSHSGYLTATGLAGKLLGDHEDAVAGRVEGMFREIRDVIETRPPEPA